MSHPSQPSPPSDPLQPSSDPLQPYSDPLQPSSDPLQPSSHPLQPSSHPLQPYSLVMAFRDLPVLVNQIPESLPVSHLVEERCRQANIPCLVDTRNLPPERSMRSLLRPVPRLQDVVTTVWPSAASLREVLGADGLLEPIAALPHVLFFAPRFGVPTLAQVEKRLARKEALGPSIMLGDLGNWPPEPPGPIESLAHPAREQMDVHEQRLQADPRLAALQYDRRVFTAAANTANGDVKPGLQFHYHQQDGLVWAYYEGPGIDLGMLVAVQDAHGRLRMAYRHLSDTDAFRSGDCFSYPEILPDGYLRMHEFWRWTSGDGSAGESRLQEVQGVTIERKVS